MKAKKDRLKERRKIIAGLGKAILSFCLAMFWPLGWAAAKGNKQYREDAMKLPQAKTQGTIAVEQAINQRRTIRSYTPQMLSLNQLSQLIWSGQGITGNRDVKYGDRGIRYAMIEAGHIGQNIFLQAEALGLKAGIVGAFDDMKLNEILNLPRTHEPLLVMLVGYSANGGE